MAISRSRNSDKISRLGAGMLALRLACLSMVIGCSLATGVAHASLEVNQFRLKANRGWLFPLRHLPANGKGLLFQNDKAPAVSDFTIRKGSDRIHVPVQLKRIRAFDAVAPAVIEPVGENRMILFRIEPVGGFEPGQTYWFSSSLTGGHEFPVTIDRM